MTSRRLAGFPEMAAGRAIGCFGLTEPDAGSDPSSMRTSARRDGGDWILDGTKMWITNGSMADIAVVWATTEAGVSRIPRRARDARLHHIGCAQQAFPPRVGDIGAVVELGAPPESAVLPGVTGMRGPLSCLNEARFGIGWGAMGAARACFKSALEYSKTRRAFGKPIGAMQLTQQKLANMATSIVQGRLIAHRLGTLKDEGRLHPVQVSITKRANVRAALDIARSARTILGANGITLEYPVSRHMANLESVLTYKGTEEVHTLIIGKELTGENAFG